MVKEPQLCFGFKSPCGGVYEGRDRELDAKQRGNEKEGGEVEPVHERLLLSLPSDAVQLAVMQKVALTNLSVEGNYGSLEKADLAMPDRRHSERYRREMEGHDPMAIIEWADENERTAEEYSRDHRADASPSPAGTDECRNS